MKKEKIGVAEFEAKIKLYKKLMHLANEISGDFEDEGLSAQCKFQKVWKDPFDGELIPRCYKVGKGLKIENRMECTIENCPL